MIDERSMLSPGTLGQLQNKLVRGYKTNNLAFGQSQYFFCMGMMDNDLLPVQLPCVIGLENEKRRRKGWGNSCM